MEEYLYLDENKYGTLGISSDIISRIAEHALSESSEITDNKAKLNKTNYFKLNRPVQAKLKKGIAHIKVFIDVSKFVDIQKISKKINDEIANKLIIAFGHIPFDIQIQVESIN